TNAYQNRKLFMFPNAQIREDLVRYRDGIPGGLLTIADYSYGSRGTRGGSFKSGTVDYKIINVSDSHPIQHVQSQAMTGFANESPSGLPLGLLGDIQGGGVQGPFQEINSMQTKVADAMFFSLL
ncbi:MAG: hypothetical protein QOF48_1331, partial [Verrucomicrobiota bacterium]